jgi:hypothetical protein
MSHKKQVVHINRLKLAYNTEIWKPKPSPEADSKPAPRPNKRVRQTVTQPVEPEEDEVRIGPFPLLKARAPVDHVEPRTPNPRPDTPDSVQTSPESPRAERRDPSYEPPRTSRSRRELHTTRVVPPLTSARARDRTQDHNPAEA